MKVSQSTHAQWNAWPRDAQSWDGGKPDPLEGPPPCEIASPDYTIIPYLTSIFGATEPKRCPKPVCEPFSLLRRGSSMKLKQRTLPSAPNMRCRTLRRQMAANISHASRQYSLSLPRRLYFCRDCQARPKDRLLQRSGTLFIAYADHMTFCCVWPARLVLKSLRGG